MLSNALLTAGINPVPLVPRLAYPRKAIEDAEYRPIWHFVSTSIDGLHGRAQIQAAPSAGSRRISGYRSGLRAANKFFPCRRRVVETLRRLSTAGAGPRGADQ